MRNGTRLLLAVACASPAASLSAQLPTPTGWDEGTLASYRSMTRCLANGLPDLARTVVESTVQSPAALRAWRELQYRSRFCSIMRAYFRSNGDIFRGALAEALYLQRNRAAPAFVTAAASHQGSAGPNLEEIAECIAGAEPAAVDRLLRTGWKSADEQGVVESLVPGIRACNGSDRLPPLVSVIRFRMALATALYRRVHASAREAGRG